MGEAGRRYVVGWVWGMCVGFVGVYEGVWGLRRVVEGGLWGVWGGLWECGWIWGLCGSLGCGSGGVCGVSGGVWVW